MKEYIKYIMVIFAIFLVFGQISMAGEQEDRDKLLEKLNGKTRQVDADKQAAIDKIDHKINPKDIIGRARPSGPVNKTIQDLIDARKDKDIKRVKSIIDELTPKQSRTSAPIAKGKPEIKLFDQKNTQVSNKVGKWTNDIPVAGTGNNEIQQSIASDNSGNLYTAFANQEDSAIYVRASYDGGNTWYDHSWICCSVGSPSITVADNMMIVAFVYGGTDLYVFNVNLNDGSNWLVWIDSGSEISNPDITSDTSEWGGWWYSYIVYNWNGGAGWDIYTARSIDYSNSYTWTYLDSYDASIYPSAPSIEYGGSVVYVAYDYLFGPGDRDITVRISDDLATTFPWWYCGGCSYDDEYEPSIAATKNLGWSTAVVGYTRNYGNTGDLDVWYDYSLDGGNYWAYGYCLFCSSYYTETSSDLASSLSGGKIHATVWDSYDVDYAQADYWDPSYFTRTYVINEANWASWSYAPPSVAVNPTKANSEEAVLAWTDWRNPSYDIYFDAPYLGYVPQLIAEAGGPYSGDTNSPISFTGSASGGTAPYSWYWDFGDGGTSTSQNPTHSYATANTYTATLTVTDSAGMPAQDTAQVTVTTSTNVVVSVDPPTQQVSQGNTFSININVNPNSLSVKGWQFDLTFDPALVQVNSLEEKNFLKQAGSGTFCVPPVIDNVAGTAKNGACTIISGPPTVSTPGTAATIHMTAKNPASGTSPLNLVNVKISDGAGQPLPNSAVNGNVEVLSCSAFWDVNKDGIVDIFDLVVVANHFGESASPPYPDWDVNKDGIVDIFDLVVVANHFGESTCW